MITNLTNPGQPLADGDRYRIDNPNGTYEIKINQPVIEAVESPTRIITRKAFINRFRPYWADIEALKEVSADVRFLFFMLENTGYVNLDDDDTITSVTDLKAAIPAIDDAMMLANGTEKEKYNGQL